MRIDLNRIARSLSWEEVKNRCPESVEKDISPERWQRFLTDGTAATPESVGQLSLF